VAASPGTEPVAERRVCSVLFCDVVGFTPLSEARDPEAIRELLSQYFAVARTVISRYGGVVEKFIGDAVMAVWGTPVAIEGDAERAVRAALDLVAAVAELGQEAEVPRLAARAGVVTGEVAVTIGAVHEGMVAGDAVNTAARVQSAAVPGQVLADGPTRRLAGSAVGFADAGEHHLKGKAEPLPLWRATRVLAAVGGSQRVDGLEAPLTGRDAELATLDSRPPGHVPAMLRPERDLAVARLAAADGDQTAEPLFSSAITGLRELSTPYHLAHGLLGHAAYLTGLGDATAAAQAIEEAQAIGQRLRCQPLLDRAAALTPAEGIRA
jgi:class 3 adenylate cyclase